MAVIALQEHMVLTAGPSHQPDTASEPQNMTCPNQSSLNSAERPVVGEICEKLNGREINYMHTQYFFYSLIRTHV